MTGPTPDKILQLITGGWACSILGAAARHGIFTALEANPDTTEGVAKTTGISRRGAQALVGGATGLGLLDAFQAAVTATLPNSFHLSSSWASPAILGQHRGSVYGRSRNCAATTRVREDRFARTFPHQRRGRKSLLAGAGAGDRHAFSTRGANGLGSLEALPKPARFPGWTLAAARASGPQFGLARTVRPRASNSIGLT